MKLRLYTSALEQELGNSGDMAAESAEDTTYRNGETDALPGRERTQTPQRRGNNARHQRSLPSLQAEI